MLVTAKLVNTPTVERLAQVWANRYVPDLSTLRSPGSGITVSELVEAASPEGRASTAAKLEDFLVALKCQMAVIQAKFLFAYIPNIVDLSESKRLAHFASLVYKKLIEVYQESSSAAAKVTTISLSAALNSQGNSQENSLSSWGMPAIEKLATVLEPVLLEYQEQHIASKDWRTLGFITTLLNFSNKLILSKLSNSELTTRRLTPSEQVLIKPYVQFIEEQVALPWQRVCAAAASHQLESPAFILVKQMLPLSQEIALSCYRRLVQLLPHHRSRRGGLDDPGITHSCLRDLEMFQAYLWLCVLEETIAPIEQELVELCVMVMTGVDVKWEMTEVWNQVLASEVLARVTPDQKTLLLPYTQGLQQAFLKQRDRFCVSSNSTQQFENLKSQSLPLSRSRESFYFPAKYRFPS
jgi:hypothetical protein